MIELSDSQMACVIEFAPGAPDLPYAHPMMITLVSLLRVWFDGLPITWFEFKESATPGVFTYKFEHQDGRKWNQKIDFNSPPTSDPPMDFGGDMWRQEAEFASHRDIRGAVIQSHNMHQVSRVRFDRL